MKISQFIIFTTLRKTDHYGTRKSLIIRLVDENGKVGLGEVAPLPGRSIESFDEALEYTLKVREEMLSGNFQPLALPPSVMFGLSSALIDLSTEPEEFTFDFSKLSFEGEKIEQNVPNVKIKPSNCLKETEERIRSWINAGSLVRIDFGNRFDEDDVIDLVNKFESDKIVYVEDPAPINSFSRFISKTDVSIALDEVVGMNPIDPFLKYDRVSHFIVKPSLIGGMQECQTIYRKALEAGRNVVFSSLIETIIGLTHIVRMGKALGCNEPYGVDTIKCFSDTTFPGEVDFKKGISKPFNLLELEKNELLSHPSIS